MRIELKDALIELRGDNNAVVAAALASLVANGATLADGETARLPDILLLSLPLVPRDGLEVGPLLAAARSTAEAMAQRGGGRLLFILSAAATMPMRRHPGYSVQMAAALAGMRGLAMEFGPKVLVNALGVGAIGEPVLAGDTAMLTHASVGRAGTLQEVTDTVLFFCDPYNSYTSGQLLAVDGGWSAGYGRNF